MDYVIQTNNVDYSQYKGKTCLEVWNEMIGEINFVTEIQDDIFIFFSMYYWNYVDFCRPQDIAWLQNQLETYKNKRVFLFCHVPIPNYFDGSSGNDGLVINTGVTNTRAYEFREFVNNYPNVIWFNGHTHYDLNRELTFENPNTYQKEGRMTQVHCSSLAYLRQSGQPPANDYTASQGYVVDVYEDRIIINGIDFSVSEQGLSIPYAQYSIGT
jgi:hypothetical protein